MIQRRRIRRFYSPLLPWVTLWAFAAVPAVLAQEAAPPQRVDSIVLTEQGSATVLRVLGTFDPERFGEIILDPLFGENTYSMEIPGAAASPDLPPAVSGWLKTQSLAVVESFCKEHAASPQIAALAGLTTARPEQTGAGSAAPGAAHTAKMDLAFGGGDLVSGGRIESNGSIVLSAAARKETK